MSGCKPDLQVHCDPRRTQGEQHGRGKILCLALLSFIVVGCGVSAAPEWQPAAEQIPAPDPPSAPPPATPQKATFGAGCFWCTEAVFQHLKGVQSVVSGYSGGTVKNPTYEQVCTGTTGHAEVIQVTYDPAVISYADLLEVFWKTHDPTTLNRQGNDVGTQYRSAVFYHIREQKNAAEQYKKKIDDGGRVPRARRDGDRAVLRVLSRRGVPPELLRGTTPGRPIAQI